MESETYAGQVKYTWTSDKPVYRYLAQDGFERMVFEDGHSEKIIKETDRMIQTEVEYCSPSLVQELLRLLARVRELEHLS